METLNQLNEAAKLIMVSHSEKVFIPLRMVIAPLWIATYLIYDLVKDLQVSYLFKPLNHCLFQSNSNSSLELQNQMT